MADLHNLVALVTGSSRGGGRGIPWSLVRPARWLQTSR